MNYYVNNIDYQTYQLSILSRDIVLKPRLVPPVNYVISRNAVFSSYNFQEQKIVFHTFLLVLLK